MPSGNDRQSWYCADCGERHDGLALSFGPPAPDPWAFATDADRAAGELTGDLCTLPNPDGGQHHFIRGLVELPIVNSDDSSSFAWNIWVSVSEASMTTIVAHWDDPAREHLEPMFGWLVNQLPSYEPTSPLATRIHTRAPGTAPLVELDPTLDHPLAVEQRDGITWHRVAELNALLLG